jgi:hypothetical protein
MSLNATFGTSWKVNAVQRTHIICDELVAERAALTSTKYQEERSFIQAESRAAIGRFHILALNLDLGRKFLPRSCSCRGGIESASNTFEMAQR